MFPYTGDLVLVVPFQVLYEKEDKLNLNLNYFFTPYDFTSGQLRGTRGWLGVKRWQLCLQDTSAAKTAIGEQQWVTVSLCV